MPRFASFPWLLRPFLRQALVSKSEAFSSEVSNKLLEAPQLQAIFVDVKAGGLEPAAFNGIEWNLMGLNGI